MKKILTLFSCFCFLAIGISSNYLGTPPANDDCTNATNATGGLAGETNACATLDDPLCGSQEEATVWYFYDVGSQLNDLEITVSPGTMSNPAVAIYSTCGAVLMEDCSGALNTGCLEPGTYYIQVGSETADEGTFDLDFTETTSISESDCANAVPISVSQTCVFETFGGDSTGACPETSDYGTGCQFTTTETVWFEYTVGANTTSIDIENLSSNLELALLDGPCGNDVSGCVSGNTNVPVTPGTTYYIAATLSSGGNSFDFDIRENELPPNNDCSSGEDIQSGSLQNTCCATGGNSCGDAGVWFEYLFPDGDATIFDLSNVSVGGDIGIEIYSGSCGGTLEFSDCGGGPFTFETPHCNGDFFVHVTSDAATCGEFSLTVTPIAACQFSEACGGGPSMAPVTNGAADCADGCTQVSCDGDCDSNGVWFTVDTDDLATSMDVIIDAASDFDPIVSIYQLDCSSPVVTCQGTNVGDPVTIAVSGNVVYLIEVASGGTPGDFEICVLTTEAQDLCATTTLGGIERPDYPDEDEEGPYCPGETVEFCFDIDHTIDPIGSGNNCQWLQGIVPTVGGGWDLDANPINGGSDGPGGSWFWLDEGTVLYGPWSSFSHPRYELITTANGDLGINFGPGGLSAGDALPGGWWFVTGGNGPNCSNDGNPNTMWGLPGGCGSSSQVEVCFDLTVKELSDISECDDPDFVDLSVNIFTFADGQTGCWSNNTCALDIPALFTGEMDCSSLVELVAEDEEICNDECLAILVETTDGSPADIFVTVLQEGNTSGANDHVFSNGAGTINDCITNEGEDVEIVIYEAYGLLPPSVCAGPKIEIQVIVYPEIIIEYEDPYYICWRNPIEITPEVSGGDGDYTYLWEDGSDGSSITLPEDIDQNPGQYEIELTVTDGFGCSQTERIPYEILEPIFPEIIRSTEAVCKDGIPDNATLELIFNDTNNGPYDFEWTSQPNGLDFINNDDDNPVIIDDENSSARTYTVFGKIIDAFGCEYVAETTFTVDEGPDLVFEVDECVGNELLLNGYDAGGVPATFEIYYDADGDWMFANNTIENADLVISGYGASLGYWAQLPGTYILLGISDNGCVGHLPLDVVPPAPPVFSFVPDSTICFGQTVTITIVNDDDYVEFDWSNGDNDNEIMVTPTDTTTYYVFVDTPEDCTILDSVRINVNPLPEINITGSTSFCPGTETQLDVQGPANYTYVWTGPSNQVINGQSAMISEAGSWDIVVTSDLGCISADQVVVTEENDLNPQIVGDDLCAGSPVELNAGTFDSYIWSTGETTQSIMVSTGGIYALTVTLGTCSGENSITITEFQPLDVALSSLEAEVCNEATGGRLTSLNLTSYETGVSGTWFDESDFEVTNPSNVDFAGETPGVLNYSFVTDGAMAPCENVEYTFTITVLNCMCPSTEINSPPNFCVVADTFDLSLIQVTTESGQWSVTPASMTIENDLLISSETTIPGDYDLTFTLDQTVTSGCDQSSTITFTVFAEPESELDLNASVCNEDNGNGPDFLDLDDLYISGSQGVWSTTEPGVTIDADNVVSFTGLDIGDYTFFYFIEDVGSPCNPKTYQVPVRVRDCSCPNVDVSNFLPLCNSSGSRSLNTFLTNPDNEPGVWSITDGPSTEPLVGGNVFVSDDAPAGIYELTYTLSNTFGSSCTVEFSGTLEVFDAPLVDFVEKVFVCNGTNITVYPTMLNLNDLVSDPSGTWFDPAGDAIADPTNLDFLNANPGEETYTFITNTAQPPCQDQEIEVLIEVVNCNCPPIVFIVPAPFCNDVGLIDLNSLLEDYVEPGVWTYESGAGQVDPIGSILDMSFLEGVYTFKFTLDDVPLGCNDNSQISLTIEAPPVVDFQTTAEVCNIPSTNGEICIDFNALVLDGTDGTWVPDVNFTGDFTDLDNVCFEGYDIGDTFRFDFTSNTGANICQEAELTTVVTVIDCNCPNITIITPDAICVGESIDLETLESMSIVDGSWSTEGGPSQVTLSNNTFDATDLTPGTYTLRYTPNDDEGCDPYSEVFLEVLAIPNAGVPSTIDFCENEDAMVSLESLLDGEDAGGTWTELSSSVGNAFDASSGEFLITGQRADTYRFAYEVPANGNCTTVPSIVEVILNTVPIADAGGDVALDCDNPNLTVGGNGSSTGPNISYEWALVGGNALQNNNESTFMVSLPGTYELTVTNTITGCSASETVEVMGNMEVPVYETTVDPSPCAGDNAGAIIVTGVSGGAGGYLYSIDGGVTFEANETFDNLEPGTYSLIIQDANGCETPPQQIIIVEPTTFTVDAGENRDIDYGEEDFLQVATSSGLENIVSIVWTADGEVICEGDPMPCESITVDPDIVTEYCVTVVDDNGCEDTDCVVIRERIVRDVYIANVFNPQGSTNNNVLYVQADNFVQSVDEFKVYDRWGELMFDAPPHAPNNKDDGWDGTYEDKLVEQGVYVYYIVVTFTGPEARQETYAGDVTIVR